MRGGVGIAVAIAITVGAGAAPPSAYVLNWAPATPAVVFCRKIGLYCGQFAARRAGKASEASAIGQRLRKPRGRARQTTTTITGGNYR
ncbi:MAG: hypothetical protein OXU71_08455 [Gammaproteobacteria bacterium]|nr:hypothetical protein [Gammaproteobacteria bacterium]